MTDVAPEHSVSSRFLCKVEVGFSPHSTKEQTLRTNE